MVNTDTIIPRQHTLGELIKVHRARGSLSQASLSDIAGLSRTHLSRVEVGSAKANPLFISRLSKCLSLTPGESSDLRRAATRANRYLDKTDVTRDALFNQVGKTIDIMSEGDANAISRIVLHYARELGEVK